jgi:hypothetical protein
MDEIDPDQQEIMRLIGPDLPRIFPIFPTAVSLYNSEVSAMARAEHDDTAAAKATHCHVWAGFQREFLDEPGYTFLDVRGLRVLNIGDQILIRAKKVDANGRHRNADTAQQRAFDAQEDLPGLPAAAARIVIGYQPDIAFSEVERVIVRRPNGRWVSQIVEADQAPYWIDITPRELPLESGRRTTSG